MADIATVMMALGSYRFSIATSAYQELERSNSWRWAKIDRLGAKPTRQFVGPGEETITLRGSIYPNFWPQNNGLQQLPLLRAEADQGAPLMMVDGNGRVWGDYVVESMRETQKVFFSDGTPRCVEFEITLADYGDQAAGTPINVQTATQETIDIVPIETQVANLTAGAP